MTLLTFAAFAWLAIAQGLVPSGPIGAGRPMASRDVVGLVAGKWTYRSFRSDPDTNAGVQDLLFGSGTLELIASAQDRLSGTLGGAGG